jgi:[acyl-carrier-protein] S-malonyltransferase
VAVALLAPGQGAQKPEFLAPWLALPKVTARLNWWSQLASNETPIDLLHLGIKADAAEIKDTAKTQPLLAAAALLAADELPLHNVAVVAGHSIGELPAAALAGVISTETAIALAAIRGRAMAAACALAPTGMTAILGGDETDVLDKLARYELTAANRNGAGQIVAAGSLDGLSKLKEDPPAKARLIPLQVAGAFHTEAMQPAQQNLAAVAEGISVHNPDRILLSNKDGTAISRGDEVLNRIVSQVTQPVRWDLIQIALQDLGVTAIIELPPAGTLVGLAKRTLPGVEFVAVNTPEDLATARDVIARHGNSPTGEPHVEFTVEVAPATGLFEPSEDLAEGDRIEAGQKIGEIQTRREPVAVLSERGGFIIEWLTHSGDPVAAGHPLVRLHPMSTVEREV